MTRVDSSRLATAFFVVVAIFLGLWAIGGVKPWEHPLRGDARPKVVDFVNATLWFGVVAAALTAAVLAATASWWARGLPGLGGPAIAPVPRWFWPMVGLAVIVAAISAVPRLADSLWDDEEYSARYAIIGRFMPGKTPPKFRAATWQETIFEYREPNNHVANSVLARLSNDMWLAMRPGGDLPFSETALRLPAFVFGVAGVAAMAWWMLTLHWPLAGVLAAWIAALHPWWIRYASECRGYGMLLFLVPIFCASWRMALIRGTPRWWGVFAVSQFLALWAYPSVVFLIAPLNVVGALWLAVDPVRRPQLARWFAANSISALPLLVLVPPLLPQLRIFLEAQSARGNVLDGSWFASTLSHFFAGATWIAPDGYPSASGALASLVAGCAAMALVVGCARMVRSGALPASLVVLTLAAPLAVIAFAIYRKHLIYASYVLFALPGVIALASVGVDALATWAARFVPRWSVGVAAVAAFALATHPVRSWLVTNTLQPIRDSVEISRGTLAVDDPPRALTASFCIPPYLYDATMTNLESVADLVAFLRRADSEQMPAALNIGMPWAAKAYNPQLWKMFTDPSLFDPATTLRGFDSGLDRMVATYKPGAIEKYDLSRFHPDRR